MPVGTIDWINASAQDAENFIREYLDTTTIIRMELSFMGDIYVDLTFKSHYEGDRLEGWVRWANIRLIETKYGTIVIKEMDNEAIYGFCRGDAVQHEKLTSKFGEALDRLYARILQRFRTEDEQLATPERGASRFAWLAWREAESKAGRKITYKQLAQHSRYTEGSLKQASLVWRRTRKNN